MSSVLERIERGKKSQDFRFLMGNGWLDCLRGRQVLDLGCGGGIYTKYLSGLDVCPVGLDTDLQTLKITREYLGASCASLCCGTSLCLPFPDASFEGIICVEVLSHIPHDMQLIALGEMFRVLRKRGWLIISVHNNVRFALQRLARFKKPASHYPNPGLTIYPLSKTRLMENMNQVGFRKEGKLEFVNLYNSAHQKFSNLFPLLVGFENFSMCVPGLRSACLTILGKFQKP